MRSHGIVALTALTLGMAGCGGSSSSADSGTQVGTSTARGACAVRQNGWDLCKDLSQAECEATTSSTPPQFHAGTQCIQIGYERHCGSWTVKGNDICPDLPDPCTQQFSGNACSMCAQGSCGFCASSGVCLSGDASGPLHATCPTWIKSAASCPGADPCFYRYGCESCIGNPGCGYCASDFTCRSGTSSGPASGSGTTCSNWQFSSCSTSTGDTCARCLAACSGLPGCCTGTGCICDSACP